MRQLMIATLTGAALALATVSVAQSATRPPRLLKAELGPAPWNVQSGGIAACEVKLGENGAVMGVDLVQDVPPYGSMLSEALRSWEFEPALEQGRPAGARILVLGLFLPPTLHIITPENPRYKTTEAPAELPWPTFVAVPPYPPNAVGGAKVIVEADVSAEGTISSARVLTPESVFNSAALDTARKWTFRPATTGGRGVKSRAFLVFSFVGMTP